MIRIKMPPYEIECETAQEALTLLKGMSIEKVLTEEEKKSLEDLGLDETGARV